MKARILCGVVFCLCHLGILHGQRTEIGKFYVNDSIPTKLLLENDSLGLPECFYARIRTPVC